MGADDFSGRLSRHQLGMKGICVQRRTGSVRLHASLIRYILRQKMIEMMEMEMERERAGGSDLNIWIVYVAHYTRQPCSGQPHGCDHTVWPCDALQILVWNLFVAGDTVPFDRSGVTVVVLLILAVFATLNYLGTYWAHYVTPLNHQFLGLHIDHQYIQKEALLAPIVKYSITDVS